MAQRSWPTRCRAQLWLDVGAQDPYFQATEGQLASALHIHLTSGLAPPTTDTGTSTGTTTSASTPGARRRRKAVELHTAIEVCADVLAGGLGKAWDKRPEEEP
jgi:hypothetical protein